MKFLINSGKYVRYILNILYFILFVKIVSSLFLYDYLPKFFRNPYFGLTLLICILILTLIKRKL